MVGGSPVRRVAGHVPPGFVPVVHLPVHAGDPDDDRADTVEIFAFGQDEDVARPGGRIENAQNGVIRTDLYFMLQLYGVTDKNELEKYWALALAGREKGWWEKYRDVIVESLGDYIAFESSADQVRTWSLGTVHGLLQTEAYARETFAAGKKRTPEEIDRVVLARIERQKRLTIGDLSMWAIIDETVLTRPVGGATVLRGQLDHFLGLPDAVTLQVVPVGTTWHPGLSSAFTLMSFTDYPEVAFVDGPMQDRYVEAADEVAGYILMFDQLRAAGANPRESRRMIEAARERIDP